MPIVSIIGRPNTGKSTLFNLLAKRKISIIDDQPGVTRDPVKVEVNTPQSHFLLCDSGGMFNYTEDELNRLVHKKSEEVIGTSDIMIFLCDIRELTPLDENVMQLIRKQKNKKVILVLNKADRFPEYDYSVEISEFYSLGIGEPVLISALHQKGIPHLLKIIDDLLPEYSCTAPAKKEEEIHVSIIGKPNTGKSSLLNRLAGRDISIVYDRPGTTRDTVDFSLIYNNKKILFADTAGIRKKNRVHENIEYYSVTRAIRSMRNNPIVLLMIDASQGMTEQDKKIISLAQQYGTCLIILVNKWDLVDKEDIPYHEYVRKLKDELPAMSRFPVLTISVLHNQRVRKVLDLILDIWDQYAKRIPTTILNRFLNDFSAKRSFQAGIRLYYGVQVRSSPPVFQIFANHPHRLKDHKKRELLNALHDTFGFEGVPVIIQYKRSKGKSA